MSQNRIAHSNDFITSNAGHKQWVIVVVAAAAAVVAAAPTDKHDVRGVPQSSSSSSAWCLLSMPYAEINTSTRPGQAMLGQAATVYQLTFLALTIIYGNK